MIKNNLSYSSNCELSDADIAFFPLIDKSIIDNLYNIPEKAKNQKKIGLACLPPIFLNRIKLHYENGKTFTSKNVPLQFSFLDFGHKFEASDIYNKWFDIISHIQNNGFPAIWVVTPQYVCDLLIPKCLEGQGNFYYHEPLNNDENNYSLITHCNDSTEEHQKIQTYPLKERDIFYLS